MKLLRLLLCSGTLLFTLPSINAQLSAHSRLWAGGIGVAANSENIGLTASPGMHHFLSPHLTLGAQLNLFGTFEDGMQQVLLTPEMRYYMNPRHERLNWFVLAGGLFAIFNKNDNIEKLPFQFKTGLGAALVLGEGVVFENKFTANFQNRGAASFFEHPQLRLESNLIYYLAAEDRYSPQEFVPGIGRGSWLIGGSNAGMSLIALPAITDFSIFFSPRAGYFFSDRVVAGLGLHLGYNNVSTDFTIREQNFGTQTITWSFHPFFRYYVAGPQARIQPFAEVNGDWRYSQINAKPFNSIPPDGRNSGTAFVAIKGGVDVFLNRNVALEPILNINTNLKNGHTNITLQLGFQFFLSGKGK